jgi:NCAIR mutase (PurE)-related protein
MNERRVRDLLERVRSGQTDPDAAVRELSALPFADLGFAHVDHHRALRQGVPEVVLGERKTVGQIVAIAQELMRAGHNVLVTRLSPEQARGVCERIPELCYSPEARVATYEHQPVPVSESAPVAVITAGTSDIPVAEEALETLRMFGIPAVRVFDVGVAGIHRVVSHLDVLAAAPALIVVAGMEGALASVIGGMVGTAVVAVPTSVGYGVALGWITPLLGMLTACASGVTVVNIDNGFGAAMAVVRIVRARLGSRGDE